VSFIYSYNIFLMQNKSQVQILCTTKLGYFGFDNEELNLLNYV